MGKKLTNFNKKQQTGQAVLTDRTANIFKISICEQLDNNYCFKKLKPEDMKQLHAFIDETVGKQLTISLVDQLFLRTKGQVTEKDKQGRAICHYGKDSQPFRIFGYYNTDGYFNITKIDPKHRVHKS